MPDPIAPLGSAGQSQALAPVPSPVPATPDSSERAGSAQSASSEAARLEGALAKQVAPDKGTKAPPSMEEAVKEFRQYLASLPADLKYSKDEATGTVVFKVVNPITREVIRQYPPEEILQVARRLRQISKGQDRSGILLDHNL